MPYLRFILTIHWLDVTVRYVNQVKVTLFNLDILVQMHCNYNTNVSSTVLTYMNAPQNSYLNRYFF